MRSRMGPAGIGAGFHLVKSSVGILGGSGWIYRDYKLGLTLGFCPPLTIVRFIREESVAA